MNKSQLFDVVVIGGAGFIGGHLVRLLLNDGRTVRVVSRHAGQGRRDAPRLEYLRGSVADADSMMTAIEGASVVYDLAMGGGETWADYERNLIQGSRNVANACLRHGVRRLIYTSTSAALYLGRRGAMDESAGTDRKGHIRSYYSRGKIEAERLLLEMHSTSKLPVVILRPAIVMGPGGFLSHGGIGYWASNTCCLGWGNGKHPMPFVLVQDVAQALFAAMDVSGVEGMTFNLAGDVRLSAAEYVKLVAERSRRNFRFYPRSLIRIQALEIAKWIVKWIGRKSENPYQSYHDIKSRSMLSQIDCSAAKRILGWKPADSLEVFVREAIDCHLKPIHPGDLRLVAAPK